MHGRTTDGKAFESIFRVHCMADSPAFLPRSSQPSSRKPAINTTSKQPCLPQTADLEAPKVSLLERRFAGPPTRTAREARRWLDDHEQENHSPRPTKGFGRDFTVYLEKYI